MWKRRVGPTDQKLIDLQKVCPDASLEGEGGGGGEASWDEQDAGGKGFNVPSKCAQHM